MHHSLTYLYLTEPLAILPGTRGRGSFGPAACWLRAATDAKMAVRVTVSGGASTVAYAILDEAVAPGSLVETRDGIERNRHAQHPVAARGRD